MADKIRNSNENSFSNITNINNNTSICNKSYAVEEDDEEEIVYMERDDGQDISLLLFSTASTSTTTTPSHTATVCDESPKKCTPPSYRNDRVVGRRRQRARLLTPRQEEIMLPPESTYKNNTATATIQNDDTNDILLEQQQQGSSTTHNYTMQVNTSHMNKNVQPENDIVQKKKVKASKGFTPQNVKKQLPPISTVVAKKSIVGTRPSHWTNATTITTASATRTNKTKNGINSTIPLLSSSSINITSNTFSPGIQQSTLRQQRAALRSAAAASTSSSIKKKKLLRTNAQSSTGANCNDSSLWKVNATMNFYPSFLVDHMNQNQQEEYEFVTDTATTADENVNITTNNRSNILSTLSSLHTSPKQHPNLSSSSSTSTIGPMIKELFKIRSSREGKLLRLNATSYSYKCSRFMKGDPRTHTKHHVDITLLGSLVSDNLSQVSSIFGYLHDETKEVANFCFTPETIQDLKLHHGSQLRIYDCIRVNSSIPTYICTSFAEPHPTGLPAVPEVDIIKLPNTIDEN